jgi:hypothetical protein
MSFNRNTDRDRRRTREVLAGGSRVDEVDASRNWLGHSLGSGTANIDDMLVEGATRERLKADAGRRAIREHLYHLRTTHGLPIHGHDGMVPFDRQALGEAGVSINRR